jgi:tyrosine-protein phosphatase SIW14
MFGGKPPIADFTRLSSWLARGGQPTSKGYRLLAELGFKTVVDLRLRSRKPPPDSADRLRTVRIPVRNHRPPQTSQAIQWLALCADSSTHPIFVHCKKGEGRTATFAALVRIAQGWPIDRVLNEQIHTYAFPESAHSQIAFLRDFHARVAAGEIAVPWIEPE